MKLIPAIDLKDNKCVRLSKGAENSAVVYNEDPLEQAKYFEEQGCEKLHVIDLDAAFGRPDINREIIFNIKKSINIPIQLGGGIRSQEILRNYIDHGIDYVIIGSFAVENPDAVLSLSKDYLKKIYFALDVLDKKIMIKGWEDKSNLTTANVFERFNQTDLKGYVFTDVSRDGMLSGINLDLINENLNLSEKNLIVGGGLSNYQDLEKIAKIKSKNFEGVIVGKAFYVGNIDIKKGMEILNKNA